MMGTKRYRANEIADITFGDYRKEIDLENPLTAGLLAYAMIEAKGDEGATEEELSEWMSHCRNIVVDYSVLQLLVGGKIRIVAYNGPDDYKMMTRDEGSDA